MCITLEDGMKHQLQNMLGCENTAFSRWLKLFLYSLYMDVVTHNPGWASTNKILCKYMKYRYIVHVCHIYSVTGKPKLWNHPVYSIIVGHHWFWVTILQQLRRYTCTYGKFTCIMSMYVHTCVHFLQISTWHCPECKCLHVWVVDGISSL